MVDCQLLYKSSALVALLAGCVADERELASTAQAVVSLPQVLATGQDFPVSVAVSADQVYWISAPNFATEPGSILATPKAGGAVTVVESDIPDIGFLRLDHDRLYWPMGAEQPGVGGIQTRRQRPGPVTDLVDGLRVFHIALSGAHIYLATPDDGGKIQRIAKTGGALTTLAGDVGPGLDNIPFLAITEDRVVFSQSTFEDECDGRVRYVAKTGGPIVTLESEICNLLEIEADDHWAYWTEYDSEINIGRLMRIKLDGTSGPAVMDTIAAQAMFLARDAVSIYYTAWDGSNGVIRRVPKHPGTITTLASEQLLPFSIAVDPTHLYWTTILDGEVKRVAKR